MADSRRKSALAAIALALVSVSLASRAQAAGGAYSVDDAAVDDAGKCKVETWLSASDHSPSNRTAVVAPNCTFGLIGHRVETSASFARTRTDGVYGSNVTFKGKTPIPGLDFNANNKFGIALVGSITYDVTANYYSTGFVALPVSIRISEPLVLLANIGHSHDQYANLSSTTWGAAFELNLKPIGYDKLTLIGEVFGNDRERDPRTQLGLRFTPAERIDLDLIYGHRLTGLADNWLTAGMTFRF